ncbi:RagB/SusD family nutrient uptake outer membrane protein [Membranihabitans maritimus]|uniref:RagB/SusD family nutrient uptake outer membrane protein n=1 Tax=Membranihabitans maritimus TaxID=2904244 RepID=UPI001F1DAB77|nr:RagB/SusD family nutrient uptake outer membrane protein [Membranihabitans maritimus]
MNKVKYIRFQFSYLVFIFGISLMGCSNEFLSENPKDEISEAIFWETKDDAHRALMGVYNTYTERWGERINNLDKSMIWMSAYAGYASWRTFAWSRDVEIEPTHGSLTTMWRKLFVHVSRANYFLENIDNVDMDESEKNQMIAEVRFLRAYSYFWLSQTFGNVPLADHSLTFEEANSIAQSSAEGIKTFILEELNTIINQLPWEREDSEDGRIEKGAALTLMGRVLMAEKRWSEAADAFQQIMESGRYEIDPRFKQLFEDEGEVNREFIFVNKYMENEFGEAMSQHTIRSSLYGGFNACNVFQHFIDEFLMTDGKSIEESNLYDPTHPFENRDPRLYASVLLTGYSEVFGEVFQGDPATIARIGQTGANITGYILQKFWDREFEGNRQYYGADYPHMRYAEVLLSRLEAELEAGNMIDQDLLDMTINQVRQRDSVNMPPVTETNPAELREIVRRERFVELAFEAGIRYFDLRRWELLEEEVDRQILGMKVTNDPDNYDGIYNINEDGHIIIGDLRFYPHNYYWPIPISELDVNQNLSQNPGYN